MRPTRALVVLLATACLSLTACGGDDADDGASGPGSGSSAGSTETDGGSDSGDEGGASFADCSAITAEEMGAVLGEGTGSAEVPPASDYCAYALDDPSQPSVTIEQFTTDDFADGWDGAKANVTHTAIGDVDGTPQDVADVGDGAVLVVGPSVGGSSLQSIGLVLIGDTVVRASVLQAIDLDEDAMAELTTDILELVASKA